MEVIDNRIKLKTRFYELNFCDVFSYDASENVYMKITTVIDKHGRAINAVNLSTGYTTAFNLNEFVTRENARMIIE